MISLLYPNIVPIIREMPGGILPLNEDYLALIVKVPKEYILAAKLNGSLKIYLVPILIGNQETACLVTAFFDDEDEPLVVKTPLFLGDFAKDLFKLLSNDRINVHFFDELSREQLVYRANVIITEETKNKIDEMLLIDFSLPKARLMMDKIDFLFGSRTSKDDEHAINIVLNESVHGEGIFILDINSDCHSYHGSRGFSHSILEREEPGNYQEEDIIQCLQLIFQPEQIFLSPKRTYDNEEMCDILVVTDTKIFIIQAKDSPNIERISKQKLPRKRKNILSALKKAIAQVKGSIGYYRRISGKLEFLINGVLHTVDTKLLEVKTLIIVKELFNDQYDEFSPLLLDIYKTKDIPCIALDYPEFYLFCTNLLDEKSFFDAYKYVMDHAITTGIYPRIRFGLVE